MTHKRKKPAVGDLVVLVRLPTGLLNGLPVEDQRAIAAMVGKPVRLVRYDEDGRAELEFDEPFEARTEASVHTHTIWVEPEFVVPFRS